MTTVEDLRRLVDEIPESELDSARRYLEYFRDPADPLLQKLYESPIDDEDDTVEERAEVEEGLDDERAGRTVSQEELRAELGLRNGPYPTRIELGATCVPSIRPMRGALMRRSNGLLLHKGEILDGGYRQAMKEGGRRDYG